MKNIIFPFTAIIGQDIVKKALILNAINPLIGGVLIKGDRGTGKTTAVRALADLLPEIKYFNGCPFNCHIEDPDNFCEFCNSVLEDNTKLDEKYNKNNISPEIIKTSNMKVVELPLSATEDRIVGSLDIEKALKEGIKGLEPGILASANRNILYVDEINLLDDSLVDILLDAAAFGVNNVEREGISISHPSRFILVGTMNPDEGELRGQLSDRIGLKIDVSTINDIGDRIAIMSQVEDFGNDPFAFRAKFEKQQKELREKIIHARGILSKINISSDLIELIARVSRNLNTEGHRSDISILKTSKTIAAFNNHPFVIEDDLVEAIFLVLGELDKTNNKQQIQNAIDKAKQDMEREKEENESCDNNNANNNDNDNNDNNDNLNTSNSSNNDSNDENNNNLSNNSNPNSNNNNNLENNNGNDNNMGNELDEGSNLNNGNNNNELDDNDEDNIDNHDNTNNSNINDAEISDDDNKSEGHFRDSNLSNVDGDDNNINFAQNNYEIGLNSIETNNNFDIKNLMVLEGKDKDKKCGRHNNSSNYNNKGKYVKSKANTSVSKDIAIDATIRASILNNNHVNNSNNNNNRNNPTSNSNNSKLYVNINKDDLKEKVRKHKLKADVILLVDMSGSMTSDKKVNQLKSILKNIISAVAIKRDKLAVIGFKGRDYEIIVPNTTYPKSFLGQIEDISVGGTTPMAIGLKKAFDYGIAEKKKDEFVPMILVLSDGMPNIGISSSPIKDLLDIGNEIKEEDIQLVVIDFDKKIKQGRNVNMELAYTANGRYYDLESLNSSDSTTTVIGKIFDYERAKL
ncbi:MAG: VWA domain-containing protein [Methanobacteriaceae archaeon]